MQRVLWRDTFATVMVVKLMPCFYHALHPSLSNSSKPTTTSSDTTKSKPKEEWDSDASTSSSSSSEGEGLLFQRKDGEASDAARAKPSYKEEDSDSSIDS